MSIYAIGDIQGCQNDLERLLDRVNFDPSEDTLWIAGDIVNRGPESLRALRFVRKLGERVITVLGNHDMHLLAAAHDEEHPLRPGDTLAEILEAPDAAELLEWLRHRRFLHHDPELGYAMVHAGLPPQWDMDEALARSHELETVLQGPDHAAFFKAMYGNQPDRWDPALDGHDRHRFLVNCFTRMRFVDEDGHLDMATKCAPGEQPEGLIPWYAVPGRRTAEEHILFGHWSTAGQARDADYSRYNVYPLDTGCVWGGALTAFRLDEDGGWISIPCPGRDRGSEQ